MDLRKDNRGLVGCGVGFERIPARGRPHLYGVKAAYSCALRRITGYLVGDLDRFNNGKRAEERDRIRHDAAMYKV